MTRPGRRPVLRREAPAAIADAGLHRGATAPYAPLATVQLEGLIESALSLMDQSGVVFDLEGEAVSLLQAAGCRVDADGVVRFDPALVREALAGTPRSVKLWDRTGTRALQLDCDHTWFACGMTCIRVYDLDTGIPRDSTGDDLALITRVADALPNIDAVCVACKNVARSDIHGEIEEFAIMAENTAKPLEYLCEHAASLEVAIAMASAIRGGAAPLAEKPYFLQIITPLPLNYHRTHCDQIITAARHGIPVSVGTLPIGGASTPITTAGTIVNSLATDFAAMVLAQQARRGSFCIGSSDVCFMEPATGGIGNFAQTSLADLAMCQLRRHLGLPSFTGAGGHSAARRFNQDAVTELTAGMMQSFFSRPATLDYLGSLDQGLTYSLHALLLCDDLAGLLRTMWQGLTVDEESTALGLARTVGPRGNYLAQQHTVRHCRENVWQSRYFGARLPLSTDSRPDHDLLARIDENLQQLVRSHRPPELDAGVRAALAAVRGNFAARNP
ncbi:MAG: trimethylamine methyltransferase family protein [Proteobacteria bacterium]|nr:trimethylamine methyltransferase family protein [Pseudomonadota bacterium]